MVMLASLALLSITATGQNISFQPSYNVSSHIYDWTRYSQISLATSYPTDQVGVFRTTLHDSNNVLVLVCNDDFQMYESGLELDSGSIINIPTSRTLQFDEFVNEELASLDTGYSNYYINNIGIPPGQYVLKTQLWDTSLSYVIDSAMTVLEVQSASAATNLFPLDNSKICESEISNLHFSFASYDPTLFKEFQLVRIEDSFLITEDFESAFVNPAYPVISFPVSNSDLDNGFSLTEKVGNLELEPQSLFAYTVRSYQDQELQVPILDNSGFSVPYFFKLKTDSLGCEANLMEYPHNSFCDDIDNGFENGPGSALDNWLCKTGERRSKSLWFKNKDRIEMTATGQVINRHDIVSSAIDAYGLQTVHPLGGQFSLKLGNDQAGSEAEQVSRTFTVTSANSQFNLNYAVVLDPAHDGSKRSLLRVRIFRNRFFGTFKSITNEEIIYADRADDYLRPSGHYLVGDWRCMNVDLSRYVGQSITIEITTADCTGGAHFGYAYLDFCFNMLPEFVLNLEDEYCEEEPVIANGNGSQDFTNFLYTIEECADQNGTRIGKHEVITQWFRNFEIPSINLSDQYAAQGLKFECDKYYRIKLAGINNCSGWVETVKVIRIKCAVADAGPDRCCLGTPCQVQIGSTPINGYTYSWNPNSDLTNSAISNPIYYRNAGVLYNSIKYTVTASDGECTATDDMEIFFSPPTIGLHTLVANSCFYQYTLNVSSAQSIDWNYTDDQGVLHQGNGKIIDLVASDQMDYTINVNATNPCGSVTSTITVPQQSSNNYGAFPLIGYSNVMQSNNSSKRLVFYEDLLAKGAQPAYNALEYKLEVYNMWGGKIHESTGSGGNFTNGQINWMGQIDGTPNYAHTGTYPWTLSLKNCQQKALTTQFDKARWECIDWSTTRWRLFNWKKETYCRTSGWVLYDCDFSGNSGSQWRPGCTNNTVGVNDCPCQYDVITIAD